MIKAHVHRYILSLHAGPCYPLDSWLGCKATFPETYTPVANRAAIFSARSAVSARAPLPILCTRQALLPRPMLLRTNVYRNIVQLPGRILRDHGLAFHSSSCRIWIRLDRGANSSVWAAGHGVGFKQGAIQNHQCGLLLLHITAKAFRIEPEVILRSLRHQSLSRYSYVDVHHPHLPIRILHVTQ